MDNKDSYIVIEGARAHNLKNVNLSIPRGKFVVVRALAAAASHLSPSTPSMPKVRDAI